MDNSTVSCIHSVTMQDDYGVDTTYLLVGDGNALHFYIKGVRVKTIHIGSRINDVSLLLKFSVISNKCNPFFLRLFRGTFKQRVLGLHCN